MLLFFQCFIINKVWDNVICFKLSQLKNYADNVNGNDVESVIRPERLAVASNDVANIDLW